MEQKEKVKQAAPDEKQLKQLEKKVEALKKDYEKAEAKASAKEDEIHGFVHCFLLLHGFPLLPELLIHLKRSPSISGSQ